MWFHVSKSYIGENPIMMPRVPRNGSQKIIKWEGDVPRICVSNSIFNCLLAIQGTEELVSNKLDFKENPCVYYTEEDPYLPPDCNDFRARNEMWFIKKTKFFYLARVDINRIFLDGIIVPTDIKDLSVPDKIKTVRKVKTNFVTNILKKS